MYVTYYWYFVSVQTPILNFVFWIETTGYYGGLSDTGTDYSWSLTDESGAYFWKISVGDPILSFGASGLASSDFYSLSSPKWNNYAIPSLAMVTGVRWYTWSKNQLENFFWKKQLDYYNTKFNFTTYHQPFSPIREVETSSNYYSSRIHIVT